jgi:hypothetical protein
MADVCLHPLEMNGFKLESAIVAAQLSCLGVKGNIGGAAFGAFFLTVLSTFGGINYLGFLIFDTRHILHP